MDIPHVIAGRFRVECEIGTGGMGTVYRARQLGLERPVAVKIIKREFAGDPDVADRFMREARTMAKLRHARAAMIYDAGTLPDGRHFIVMEYVEGLTLGESLARDGRFKPNRAIEVATQVLEVLAEAHKLGIIHRDLKPSNIILNERGVCVLDFGVAKVLATSTEATATHATTGSGVIIGTPRYMSPEQCLGQPVGARSDLYSLGVLLYEMLAGRPPFVDPLPSAVLVKQATSPPPPLMRFRDDVPRPIAHAVHALLAKLPDDRPKSAEAARLMLARSLKPVDEYPEPEPFAGTIETQLRRRPPFARIAALVVILAIVATALFVLAQNGETAGSNAVSALGSAQDSKPRTTAPAQRATADTFVEKGTTTNSEPVNPAGPKTAPVSSSSETQSKPAEEARRIVSALSRGEISDVRVIRTPRGIAYVAIHNEGQRGTTHFFVVEKHGREFRVSSRGQLDVYRFRGAKWTAATSDSDGDGFDEVVFVGEGGQSRARDRRVVMFVPSSRETLSLLLSGSQSNPKSVRALWSPNAVARGSVLYQQTIRRHARLGAGD